MKKIFAGVLSSVYVVRDCTEMKRLILLMMRIVLSMTNIALQSFNGTCKLYTPTKKF